MADNEFPDLDVYELRIHGVGGTPPGVMLNAAATCRVAGDDNASFHRRQQPDGKAAGAVGGRLVEAYSWGGLNAHARSRALWLLLTPFMLVNVAFHAAALPLGANPGRSPAPSCAGSDVVGVIRIDEEGPLLGEVMVYPPGFVA